MNIREGVSNGWLELKAYPLRSILTSLGIAVGISSILTMLGISSGYKKEILEWTEVVGPGRLTIHPNFWTEKTKPRLRYEDAARLRDALGERVLVSPEASDGVFFRYGGVAAKLSVKGVTPEAAAFDWEYDLRGRFISSSDLERKAKVCVLLDTRVDNREPWMWWLRDNPLEKLFEEKDLLGEEVILDNRVFRVVGILKPKKERKRLRHFRSSEQVFLPLTTLFQYFQSEKVLSQLNIDAGSPEAAGALVPRISELMKRWHGQKEDFRIENYQDWAKRREKFLNQVHLVLGGLALVSLFAGGIGIMNITLAAVNSRIREIGIRKAIGAGRKDILEQFLLESSLLGLLGGVSGSGFGLVFAYAIGSKADVPMSFPSWTFMITLLLAVGVGVLFSIYPAYLASRMDPVEALRYE